MISEEQEPTIREIAFHEAGHAVMAWLESRPLQEVSIARRYDESGTTLLIYGHVTQRPLIPGSLSGVDTVRQALAVGARITLGGPIAELKVKGELIDYHMSTSGNDFSEVKELSETVLRIDGNANSRRLTKRGHEGWIFWQWCMVHDALEEKWPLVETLADALLQLPGGTMPGPEAEEVIRDAEFKYFASAYCS
jgi:hypothetical protein